GFSGTASSVVVVLEAGHYGVAVHGLSATTVGLPITVTVGSLEAVVNPDSQDFTAQDAALTSATLLSASGNAALNADGFVSVAGHFSLTKTASVLSLTLSSVGERTDRSEEHTSE